MLHSESFNLLWSLLWIVEWNVPKVSGGHYTGNYIWGICGRRIDTHSMWLARGIVSSTFVQNLIQDSQKGGRCPEDCYSMFFQKVALFWQIVTKQKYGYIELEYDLHGFLPTKRLCMILLMPPTQCYPCKSTDCSISFQTFPRPLSEHTDLKARQG